MIQSKNDLHYYIKQDRKNNERTEKRSIGEAIKDFFFPNAIAYLYYLRHVEYYRNVPSIWSKIFLLYYTFKFRYAGRQLGYSIGVNACGPGLSLPHYGTIIISAEARLGANCRVHACVNIGASAGKDEAPQVGDNVYIGPSCVLFGDITIGSNNTIGANATVNKSFEQEHVIIAGTPAQILKTNYPNWLEINKNKR